MADIKSSGALITIIVAVYNGAKTLQQCIDSVSAQSYENKELIIIDGMSNDGTLEILKQNTSRINYWISESDEGVYSAWNKGLKHAKGDWICFLGSDDYLYTSDALKKLSSKLEPIPLSIRLAYSRIILINPQGEQLHPIGEPWDVAKKNFLKGKCLPHQGVMHRKSLFEKMGMFDESFGIGGDYELMLREIIHSDAFFIPDIVVIAMRQGGLSSNSKHSIEALFDIRRALRLHGIALPSMYWIMAIMKAYFRKVMQVCFGESNANLIIDKFRSFKRAIDW
jgi:glycosyltransferase involved in cell wall biosynthesis